MAKATTSKKKTARKTAARKRPAAKKTAKRGKPAAEKAAPKREPLEEKNGVKRPRPGGKTAQVWDIADKIRGRSKECPKRADVIEACEKKGIATATASTQFACWRVFNGFKGRSAKK